MIAGSCQFGGNRSSGSQGDNAPLPEDTEQTATAAEKEAPSQQKTPEQELEEAKAAVEDFFGKLAKAVDEAIEEGILDTTAYQQQEQPSQNYEEDSSEPQEPDAWYGKDFALTTVKHIYLTATKAAPEGDATYKVTRIGNKAWVQISVAGATQSVQTFEYADGTTTAKLYKSGRLVSTSPAPGNSLGMRLSWILVSGKDIPLAKKRSAATITGTRDVTYLGRPCQIVEETADMAGSSVTRTVYIDKEYGFIYKMRSTGNTNAGKIDVTPFEVTAFTDKPTSKDIPDINQKEDPLAPFKNAARQQGYDI